MLLLLQMHMIIISLTGDMKQKLLNRLSSMQPVNTKHCKSFLLAVVFDSETQQIKISHRLLYHFLFRICQPKTTALAKHAPG